MRPPICAICDKRFDPINGGKLVYFAQTEEDIEWRKRMKEEGKVGHPPYAEWFCNQHLPLARKYQHLPIKEAFKAIMKELKES